MSISSVRSSRIDHARFAENPIANVPVQLAGPAGIDAPAAKERRQLVGEPGQIEVGRGKSLLVIDEEVNVAIGLFLASRYGSKKTKALDPISTADLVELF